MRDSRGIKVYQYFFLDGDWEQKESYFACLFFSSGSGFGIIPFVSLRGHQSFLPTSSYCLLFLKHFVTPSLFPHTHVHIKVQRKGNRYRRRSLFDFRGECLSYLFEERYILPNDRRPPLQVAGFVYLSSRSLTPPSDIPVRHLSYACDGHVSHHICGLHSCIHRRLDQSFL